MLIISGILNGFQALKDGTIKLIFETQEPTPEQILGIAKNNRQFGWMAFKNETFTTKERDMLEGLKTDYETQGKTPSQRLRAVLYRNWEQDNLGYDDFNRYYDYRMEKIITFYKDKLN